jgi:hypothetical protein
MYRLKASTFIMLMVAPLYLAAAEISALPLQGYHDSTWNQLDEESGLVTSLPSTTSGRLIREMNWLQADLNSHKEQLTESVDASKFTFGDGIITAAMPGGLLYAAIKKRRHQQVVEQLNKVDLELSHLTQDLAEYQATVHDINALYQQPNTSLQAQLN